MGQYALIIVAGAFLAGAILMMGLNRDTYESDHELGLYQTKQLARDAALTATNLTLRKLAADVDRQDRVGT